MKKIVTLAVSIIMSVTSMAQMYVWKNGQIVLAIEKGVADSVTFQKPHDPLMNYQFSVAADRKVRFSKGNLQYNDYDYIWRFAENQYDIVGAKNEFIGPEYNGWIDLFGWGTNGYCFNDGEECHDVYETSTDYKKYIIGGSYKNSLVGDWALGDWGVANSSDIVNGNQEEWRTLTSDEWNYLLSQRENAGRKFALATVCGQPGLIVLADNWQTPAGITFTPSTENDMIYKNGLYIDRAADDISNTEMYVDHYQDNVYDKSQWALVESAGALFLPAAGRRWGTQVKNIMQDIWGVYWSTTACDYERDGNVRALSFYLSGVTPLQETTRVYGCSVRLVQEVK